MILTIEERLSDSPFVERVWRSRSEEGGPFISLAMSTWEMVITNLNGKSIFTVRGPETKATVQNVPANGDWLGIRFKVGTVMPHLPASNLVDDTVNLPDATTQAFWLNGSAWQFPTYENADTFVGRLVREGLIVREPVVDAALQGHLQPASKRTAQRYFLRTAGVTHSDVRQIERARYATLLLQQGRSILDTVHEAGYFDQPHLNRSLKHYIGLTPTQIMDASRPEQLSFLYETNLLP
jgi:AraC-like DNA-binding protein